MAMLAHGDSRQLGPCKDEEGRQKGRASPYSGAERHLPFKRALGTAVWAAGGDAGVTRMGHRPPGRAGPAARTAARRLLWSTGISMETRTCGLMWVFHLGSSHSRSLNRGPGAARWVTPEGPAVGAVLDGAALDGAAGQGSGWAAIPPPGELSLQGAALPISTEEPRGRQPRALGGSPIGPSESHCSSALLLPIPGAPQHPCPWWHGTARHGTARHGTLPASGTFPTLSICPMARGLPPSQAGAPRPCPHCLPCAAAPGHRAQAGRGCETSTLGSTGGYGKSSTEAGAWC